MEVRTAVHMHECMDIPFRSPEFELKHMNADQQWIPVCQCYSNESVQNKNIYSAVLHALSQVILPALHRFVIDLLLAHTLSLRVKAPTMSFMDV